MLSAFINFASSFSLLNLGKISSFLSGISIPLKQVFIIGGEESLI